MTNVTASHMLYIHTSCFKLLTLLSKVEQIVVVLFKNVKTQKESKGSQTERCYFPFLSRNILCEDLTLSASQLQWRCDLRTSGDVDSARRAVWSHFMSPQLQNALWTKKLQLTPSAVTRKWVNFQGSTKTEIRLYAKQQAEVLLQYPSIESESLLLSWCTLC